MDDFDICLFNGSFFSLFPFDPFSSQTNPYLSSSISSSCDSSSNQSSNNKNNKMETVKEACQLLRCLCLSLLEENEGLILESTNQEEEEDHTKMKKSSSSLPSSHFLLIPEVDEPILAQVSFCVFLLIYKGNKKKMVVLLNLIFFIIEY